MLDGRYASITLQKAVHELKGCPPLVTFFVIYASSRKHQLDTCMCRILLVDNSPLVVSNEEDIYIYSE